MKIKLIFGILILLLASSVQASTIRTAITINGMDWAQIQDTNEVAGFDMYGLCGVGPCNGVTRTGIDLTGWTWVDKEQAVGLVNDVLGSSWNGTGVLSGDTSKWFDYFDQSIRESGYEFSLGLYNDFGSTTVSTRMLGLNVTGCWKPEEHDLCDPSDGSVGPYSNSDGKFWQGLQFHRLDGYFLARPSEIPIPGAVWLFGTALIGLVGFSKRRKSA